MKTIYFFFVANSNLLFKNFSKHLKLWQFNIFWPASKNNCLLKAYSVEWTINSVQRLPLPLWLQLLKLGNLHRPPWTRILQNTSWRSPTRDIDWFLEPETKVDLWGESQTKILEGCYMIFIIILSTSFSITVPNAWCMKSQLGCYGCKEPQTPSHLKTLYLGPQNLLSRHFFWSLI